MLEFFINGLLIGVLSSMPVGAISIMSVQRTMNNGLWAGFSIGMGAGFGDLFYAAVAGFGITIIIDFLIVYRVWLAIFGGIFLVFIGYKIYTSDTIKQFRVKKSLTKRRMANDFFSSFLLAMSNPVTILGFTGFFASTGIISQSTTHSKIFMLLVGVFLGTVVWWFGISLVVNFFKNKITLRNIIMINKVTGVIIVLLGIAVLIGSFFLNKR
jgi:threonine/homoserine/homoserine lactone efflux protein